MRKQRDKLIQIKSDKLSDKVIDKLGEKAKWQAKWHADLVAAVICSRNELQL